MTWDGMEKAGGAGRAQGGSAEGMERCGICRQETCIDKGARGRPNGLDRKSWRDVD